MLLKQRTQRTKINLRRQTDTLRRQIHKVKNVVNELKQARGYLRTICDGLSDPIIILDQDGTIKEINNIAKDRFFHELGRIAGRNIFTTLPPGFCHEFKAQIELARDSQRFIIFEVEDKARKYRISIRPIVNPRKRVTNFVCFIRNITDEHLAERKLLYMAYHDDLTAIYNKAYIVRQISYRIKHNKKNENVDYGLLFLDLDNIELVNDSFGQQVGNQLLQHLTSRLLELLSDQAVVGRIGGGKFAAVFEGENSRTLIHHACEAIHKALAIPFVVSGHKIALSVSIGVVLPDSRYILAEHVIRDAYIAMYQAKKNGPGQTVVFQEAFRNKLLERHHLEYNLRQSLARNELYCVYQPIFSLPELAVIGFEALIRWRHPTLGNIPPDRFIPLAEESGMIIDIGRFVIQESSRQMSRWLREGRIAANTTMSVNISARQFFHKELLGELQVALREAGLAPENLKVEVTESILIKSLDIPIAILESFKALGIKIALDDFGTGYSSLGYIRQLPLDTIKMDRSFATRLDVNAKDAEIVRLIIELAHTLGADVVVEGIEKESILELLITFGCDMVQGFLLGRPGTAVEIGALLDKG
ncbi:MAG: EAL domain-containing protein [Deltaproteobacteria bacterium]|nr:EAL domain-containing protein [Deltaproteobacteria bacterium]